MFIKLRSLSPANKDLDCNLYLRAENINAISSPTDQDRKHRVEIGSIIKTSDGHAYAILETPAVILERLKSVSFEDPDGN